MRTIKTEYQGPTDTKGSYIYAVADSGARFAWPYDYAESQPHAAAALELAKVMGYKQPRLSPKYYIENGTVFNVEEA